jgi:hypothetical protein
MRLKSLTAASAWSLLALSSAAQQKQGRSITVAAGAFDRHNAIVTVTIPDGKESALLFLNDGKGPTIPTQVGANGEVTFVLPELKAGETRTYSVAVGRPGPAPGAVPPRPVVEARRDGAVVRVTASGKPVLTYQAEPGEFLRPNIKPIFKRGGYIHPVFTPDGRAITDDYPVDHPHHHGIWWAWTKTEYDGRQPDFWNMGDGTGRIDFESLDGTWNGRIHGGLTATTRFTDVTGGRSEVVLKDRWNVRVYAVSADSVHDLDIVSTQTRRRQARCCWICATAASASAVTFSGMAGETRRCFSRRRARRARTATARRRAGRTWAACWTAARPASPSWITRRTSDRRSPRA